MLQQNRINTRPLCMRLATQLVVTISIVRVICDYMIVSLLQCAMAIVSHHHIDDNGGE